MSANKKELLVRLRKETLAPFGECSRALEEAQYDYDVAKKLLFKKSIKQSDSSASESDSSLPEGKLFKVDSRNDNSISALFCIRAETDFVTNSADFKKLAKEISEILSLALSSGNISLSLEDFLKLKSSVDNLSVEEKVSSLSSITKEKIKVTELVISPKKEDSISLSYVHHNDKLGAILTLKKGPKTDLNNISEIKKLVLHYAASSSLFLNEEEVCSKWLEEERSKLKASLLEKNPNIPNIESIIDKQMKQIISKVTFSTQPFILDPSIQISQILINNDLLPIWGKKIVLAS